MSCPDPAVSGNSSNAGTVTPSILDERDPREITSEAFPGERLIVCRNPLPASRRAACPIKTPMIGALAWAQAESGSPVGGSRAAKPL